jgi:hypothetical protein
MSAVVGEKITSAAEAGLTAAEDELAEADEATPAQGEPNWAV